jgi:hypothetical protein
MRFFGTALTLLPFFSLAASVFAEEPVAAPAVPEVAVSASFLEGNSGVVTNGERNPMAVFVENRSEKNLTVRGIAGSFRDPVSGKFLRNTTVQPFAFPLIKDVNISIPYAFFSEMKPKDVRLEVWIDLTDNDDEKFRYTAYDKIVKVMEPEKSILDYQMISTYLLIAGLLGGVGFFVRQQLQPAKPKKAGRPAPEATIKPAASTTGYEAEWIPAHHIKSRKSKGNGAASASSGEESGPEKKSRGKKRN